MNTLSTDKKLSVIASLLEGSSVRSTERMTGVHRDTICRLLVDVGDHCGDIMDSRMRNLHCGFIQADEI
jgi:transposase-like protein